MSKPWFLSKTIIASGVAFAIAMLTGAGLIDTETGMKIESLILPLIFVFLRLGSDTPVE